jgi:hypothetical protein
MGSLAGASLYKKVGMGYFAACEVGWARRRIVDIVGRIRVVGSLAPISQRRGRARALLSMLFGRRDALLLGEGMNMF